MYKKARGKKGMNRIFCDKDNVKLECIKWNFQSGITIKFLKQFGFVMAPAKKLLA